LGHKEVAEKTYCKGRFAVLLMLKSTTNLTGLNQVLVQFWLLRERHQGNMLGTKASSIRVCIVAVDAWATASCVVGDEQ
jgi:hypothetical protein